MMNMNMVVVLAVLLLYTKIKSFLARQNVTLMTRIWKVSALA